ncbi:MAG: tetratricopeptide repeat protein [Dehalococcoidia bacterium]|nr:tetratricopeptide repeat protein [Dehalococcoidia bacterium]
MRLATSLNDKPWARSARYSLGWHWRVQRQYQEALSEFRAALLLAVELGDRPQEVLCQENIGDCLRELHRPEEAIAEYDRSFALAVGLNDVEREMWAEWGEGNATLSWCGKALLTSMETVPSSVIAAPKPSPGSARMASMSCCRRSASQKRCD